MPGATEQPAEAMACAGSEGFELEMGPWSVLGNKALSSDAYVPDFSAVRPRSAQCMLPMTPPSLFIFCVQACYKAGGISPHFCSCGLRQPAAALRPCMQGSSAEMRCDLSQLPPQATTSESGIRFKRATVATAAMCLTA